MLYVLLPCLNEAENIKILVKKISDVCKKDFKQFQILVCQDGSTDDTSEVVKKLSKDIPVELLSYKKQRGLGKAFNRLIQEVVKRSKKDSDFAIFLDADNSHSPKHFKEVKKKIDNGYSVVVVSRFCEKSVMKGFSLFRTCLSLGISIVLRSLFPIRKDDDTKLKDYTSSYRGYTVGVLKKAFKIYGKEGFVTEAQFTYTFEVLTKLNLINTKITEIPLDYRYDEKIGESKLNLYKNGICFVQLIFKLLKLKYACLFRKVK